MTLQSPHFHDFPYCSIHGMVHPFAHICADDHNLSCMIRWFCFPFFMSYLLLLLRNLSVSDMSLFPLRSFPSFSPPFFFSVCKVLSTCTNWLVWVYSKPNYSGITSITNSLPDYYRIMVLFPKLYTMSSNLEESFEQDSYWFVSSLITRKPRNVSVGWYALLILM